MSVQWISSFEGWTPRRGTERWRSVGDSVRVWSLTMMGILCYLLFSCVGETLELC